MGYLLGWDIFGSNLEPFATQVPYMVNVGNHEYLWNNVTFKPEWSNYENDSGGEGNVMTLTH